MPTLKELFTAGNYPSVLRQATKQLQTNPADADALLHLAKLRAVSGDHVGALQLLGKVPLARRNDVEQLVTHARVLGHTGAAPQGLALARKAAVSAPKEHVVALTLGQLALQAGHVDEAHTALQRAVALKPNDAGTHLSLAGCYSAKKDQRCFQHLLTASKLAPQEPAVQLAWVEVLLPLGRVLEAKQLVTQALALRPNHPQLTQAMARVQRMERAKVEPSVKSPVAAPKAPPTRHATSAKAAAPGVRSRP